jgi:UDP:flavonoid glycosyltransferase YjiC (YdhE family)
LRFLFTCIPGFGHFNPLVPLARALTGSGHAVGITSAPSFADVVTQAGFEFIPGGLDWDERHLLETVPELSNVAKIFRGEWMMRNLFLDRSPRRMIPDLLQIIPQWRPDVLVAGSFEYGGLLAAEKADMPYATATYTVPWNRWVLRHALGRRLARIREEFELPDDPKLEFVGRYLDLCFAPPSWRFEPALLDPELTRLVRAKVLSFHLPLRQRIWGLRALILQKLFARSLRAHPEDAILRDTTQFVGATDQPEAVLPALSRFTQMPRQPTVFVSLGTVLSAEYPGIFEKILIGLRDKPVNLIMTMGGKIDPQRFGPQRENIWITDFLQQDDLRRLLPYVDLCVNHAGYSSVVEALSHGIPLVLLPLTSDAPMNTRMCMVDGVAASLPPEVWGISPKGLPVIRAERLTSEGLSHAILQALHDPTYKAAALRIRKKMDQRPGLTAAVKLLEELASSFGPPPSLSPH